MLATFQIVLKMRQVLPENLFRFIVDDVVFAESKEVDVHVIIPVPVIGDENGPVF